MNRIVVLCFLGDPLLSPTSETGTGGFNSDSKELFDILSTTNFYVTFITNITTSGQESYIQINDKMELYRLPLLKDSLENQNLLPKQSKFLLNQLLKIFYTKNDCFMIHSLYWFSGYLAFLLKKELHLPFIHTTVSLAQGKIASNAYPKCKIQRELEDLFLSEAELILSITNSEAEMLQTEYKIPASKIMVVGRPVGLCIRSKNKFGIADNSFILHDYETCSNELLKHHYQWNSRAFLYVGRLVPDKGVKQIISAWYQLYLKNVCTPPLWIVGGSPDEIDILHDELKRELSQWKQIEKNMQIYFWGYLPFESINTLLLRALVLVEHSKYESGGRVILEAMSTSTPVIATPFGFAKDFIKDWFNGFLVDYNDVDMLAVRMSHFIHQPLISDALGLYAHELYLYYRKFWNYSRKHLTIYEAILSHEKILLPEHKKSHPVFENYFKKGAIYKISPSKKSYFIQLFSEKIGLSANETIESIDNKDGKCLLWKTSDYYIKHLYSIFNQDSLWNPTIDRAVINSDIRFKRMIISSTLPQIVSTVFSDIDCRIYAVEKGETFQSISNSTIIKAIVSVLYELNKFYISDNQLLSEIQGFRHFAFSKNHENTLKAFWNDILDAERNYKCIDEIIQIADALLLDAAFLDSASFGLNYGRSIFENCIFIKGKIQFLPSDSIFWGETGYDAGRVLYELLIETKNIYSLKKNIFEIADIYFMNPKKLLNWTLMLLNRNYIQLHTMKLQKEKAVVESTILQLYNIYMEI